MIQPSVAKDATTEVTASFSETVRALFSERSVIATLQLVVDLAVGTIDGCDFAGIFLVQGDVVTTPVITDPLVTEIHAAQQRAGEGPCLDALANGGTIYAQDLADDTHWPHFAPVAASVGIRSILAFGLSDNGTRGALNCFARYPQAFGVIDRGKGALLAQLSHQALVAARAHEDEERHASSLQAALITREVIGQAQGILMERERITAGQAFDILRQASQHLNVKLRDVAQSLVDTGERPDTG